MFNVRISPKHGTLRELYGVTDYEILALDRTARFYHAMSDPEWQRTVADRMPFSGSLRLNPSPRAVNLLRLMSVRYVVVPRVMMQVVARFGALGWRHAEDGPTGPLAVLESPKVLPRAYVAYDRQHAADGDEALDVLLGGMNPWRSVVLEGSAAAPAPAVRVAGRPVRPATIATYEPTRVVVETSSPEPGVLVLTDTFYPGWKATVDGVEQAILRANYLFRGVEVPAGTHHVEFLYQPLSHRAGAIVSFLALCTVALLCLQHGRRPADP